MGFRLPKRGWITSPFAELKYHGRKDDLNYSKFIQRFERIAIREKVPDEDLIHYLGTCLKISAAAWFDNCEFETYREAKTAFL